MVKLVLAAGLGGTSDIPQLLSQAQAFLAGRDLMDPASTGNNPSFFPTGHYLIAAAALLVSEATGTAFAFWIKTPAIAADLGAALLLTRIPAAGARAALAYMLSPVSLLLSVYHGQLHTVAAVAAFLGLWLAATGRSLPGALALALAASVRQHFAVLLLPALRSARQRALALLLFAGILLVMSAPLLGSTHPGRVLGPTWTPGQWGYALVLVQGPRVLTRVGLDVSLLFGPLSRALVRYGAALYWLWVVAFALWLWRRPQVDPWRAALFFLLGLYAIAPGFGVQWLVWALPFWVVVNVREALAYSALGGALLAGTYWAWTFNAKYGVASVAANLHRLGTVDLALYLVVGALGVITWAFCVRSAWRLARS